MSIMGRIPKMISGRNSVPEALVISLSNVTPKYSLHVLINCISVLVKDIFNGESMRKQSCLRWSGGTKLTDKSRVPSTVAR